MTGARHSKELEADTTANFPPYTNKATADFPSQNADRILPTVSKDFTGDRQRLSSEQKKC